MEMDPLPGYEYASWEQGYGDFPACRTSRRCGAIPWLEATAFVLCDVVWHDGSPVAPSPRQVLRRQVERAEALGYTAMFGSELEFFLFEETYDEAHAKHYRDLTPSVTYIEDYHILATTHDEPFLRQIRNGMDAAGIPVEFSKGEAGRASTRSTSATRTRSRWPTDHVDLQERRQGDRVASTAARSRSWPSTDTTRSARRATSTRALWTRRRERLRGRVRRRLFRSWLGGQIAYATRARVSFRAHVNSYKRYQPESWAPTTLAWGYDNRTCGFRIVGHGRRARVESRIPGADANPYLAFAAMIAAGLHGIENELELGAAFDGNAYDSDVERFPSTLREAIAALESGTMARRRSATTSIDHYLTTRGPSSACSTRR